MLALPRHGRRSVGHSESGNGLSGQASDTGKPDPQAVLYRSFRRLIRRNANGWKNVLYAVRQSLRAGLYGHWRADVATKEAYDYCAQQMQDARDQDQYRLSSPYDLHSAKPR